MPFALAERQELVERALLEQRVAAGQHDAVEVGLAGEAQRHGGLVEAGADRPDHAGAAQLDEGRIAAGHRLGEAAVGLGLRALRDHVHVVDQHHVDARHAEPQQGLLDGAQRAIAAVVEGRLERQPARPPARHRLARGERRHPAADLGGEHEAVARPAPERVAVEQLAAAVAVVGRRIEVARARPRSRRAIGRGALVFAQREAEAADRRAAEAERARLHGRAAELAQREGFAGHDGVSRPCSGSPRASRRPPPRISERTCRPRCT